MGWIATLVTIPALAMLCFVLWRREGDKGWRDQAGACGNGWTGKGFHAPDAQIGSDHKGDARRRSRRCPKERTTPWRMLFSERAEPRAQRRI